MKTRIIVAAVLLILMTVPAWSQDDPQNNNSQANSAMAQNATLAPEAVSAAPPTYLIGPDDTLHVSVWKEPDLTATLPVRPDGMISLPLLNDVQAAGLTPMQLSMSISAKLKKYLADPHVTVVVTAINSRRVYVTGEVLHTGPITLVPGMTVLQGLASAGFTQFANTRGIYVLRTSTGKQEKFPVNYKKLLQGDASINFALKPGDTIVVP